MDMKELSTKNVSDLHRLLAEARDELRELRFRAHEQQLPQVHRIRVVRQNIARLITAINAKNKAVTKGVKAI